MQTESHAYVYVHMRVCSVCVCVCVCARAWLEKEEHIHWIENKPEQREHAVFEASRPQVVAK
jgi:hypothetical protein